MGGSNHDKTHCHSCGVLLTPENKGNYTNILCKDCRNKQGREYKKRRQNDPSDSYREYNRLRAKAYYEATGRNNRDDRMAKYKTPCLKCGEKRPWCIAFHHIVPQYKSFNIGYGTMKKIDEQMIADEVRKCVCLCENCHREFHHFYGHRMKHPREALEEYLGMKLPTFEGKENENV